MAKCGEEGGVEALQGPGMMGIWSPSITWKRSTCSSKGSQTGLPRLFISQTGCSFGSKSSTGSKPPFRPLGHTTWSPHCRSLCTSSWQRCLQALLLGAPSIMVLIWPSLDRGTCRAPLLSHKRCMPNYHLCQWVGWVSFTASSKEERHAWCGCAHTVASPNAISPSTVLPGAIKRNAMSHLGLSKSPHAPAHGRGLIAQIESHLWPEIVIERGKNWVLPTPPELTTPRGWCP